MDAEFVKEPRRLRPDLATALEVGLPEEGLSLLSSVKIRT